MKNYNYKKKNYFKIIFVICIFVIIGIFTVFSLKNERKLTFIEGTIKDIGVFFAETLYAPIKFVKDKVEVYSEKEEIYKKYKELQAEYDSIESKNARIKELEKENKDLKSSLDLNKSLSDYEIVNATVVSRDTGYWYDKLVINKGKNDDINNKMAVVSEGGLIGYISETSKGSSNVQLLTLEKFKNKISVKISLEDEYVTGLLIGYDKKKNIYKIEGVSYSGEIKEGAMVTTTGLSENFPSGILVGTVTSTTTDNFDLGKIIEVKPSVNFENISFVTILKRNIKDDNN